MYKLEQNRAPIYEALQNFKKMRVVPFDVPGTSEDAATRSWLNCWASAVSASMSTR